MAEEWRESERQWESESDGRGEKWEDEDKKGKLEKRMLSKKKKHTIYKSNSTYNNFHLYFTPNKKKTLTQENGIAV